jgi:mRNA interferase RelE/StbE
LRVKFESSFARDLKRVKDRKLRKRIGEAIERFESAAELTDVGDFKKLKGYKEAYRMRIGDYRLGFLLRDRVVIMVRFLDRKNIYRYFP